MNHSKNCMLPLQEPAVVSGYIEHIQHVLCSIVLLFLCVCVFVYVCTEFVSFMG